MKKLFRNRTLIGILCIVSAFIMCFILTPLFNRSVEAKTEVVRFTKAVKKGEPITTAMIETATVGSYNLPDGVIKDKGMVIGQYAAADTSKGDYVFLGKLSETPITKNDYLLELNGTKQAISITIPSFAGGLSGKLEEGDIISVIAAGYGDLRETIILNELKYVQVLAVTAGSGRDAKAMIKGQEDGDNELPATVTVLADEVQAKLLADLERNSTIHISLIYRGTKENADKFLEEQMNYIIEQYYTEENQAVEAQEEVTEGGWSYEDE